jgi:hypothetical protein
MILSTSNPESFSGYEAVRSPLSQMHIPHSLDFLGAPPDLSHLRVIYDELRTFVKKRDTKGLPPSVRLYVYAIVNPGSGVRTGILANASLSARKVFWGIVVSLWPIHWLLTLEGEPDLQLLDISEWANEDYKTKRTLTVAMPCRWTFAKYPLDFRSPEKYRRDGFIARMAYEGYIPEAGAGEDQNFAGAVAFARRRGTLTPDGIFLKQFATGTYAEYRGAQVWFEGKRRNEVREYLKARIALEKQKDVDAIYGHQEGT